MALALGLTLDLDVDPERGEGCLRSCPEALVLIGKAPEQGAPI